MSSSRFGMFMGMAAAAQASSADAEARRAVANVENLEARVDRLALLCESLWTIIRDELKITDEALLDRVTEIDLTDGRLDGKVNRSSALTCHKCSRTISRRFANCMYCQAPVAHDPFA